MFAAVSADVIITGSLAVNLSPGENYRLKYYYFQFIYI